MRTSLKKFLGACCFLILGHAVLAQTSSSQDSFVNSLQERTIQWFLDVTPRETGLTPDRWPTPSPSSIAAVGFSLTTYPIAVERKMITRDEAAARCQSRRNLGVRRFLLSLHRHQIGASSLALRALHDRYGSSHGRNSLCGIVL